MDQKSKVFGKKKDDDFSFLYEAGDSNELPTDKNLESDVDYYNAKTNENLNSTDSTQNKSKDDVEAFFEQNSENTDTRNNNSLESPIEETKTIPTPEPVSILNQPSENFINNSNIDANNITNNNLNQPNNSNINKNDIVNNDLNPPSIVKSEEDKVIAEEELFGNDDKNKVIGIINPNSDDKTVIETELSQNGNQAEVLDKNSENEKIQEENTTEHNEKKQNNTNSGEKITVENANIQNVQSTADVQNQTKGENDDWLNENNEDNKIEEILEETNEQNDSLSQPEQTEEEQTEQNKERKTPKSEINIQKLEQDSSNTEETHVIENKTKTDIETAEEQEEEEEEKEIEEEEAEDKNKKDNKISEDSDYIFNNFSICDKDIADLEKINDDFASEIEAERIKTEQEEKKRIGEVEEEKKDNMELEPLKGDDKLGDIAELNLNNIEEFLKKNGKITCQVDKQKEETDKIDEKNPIDNEIKETETTKPNLDMKLFDKALNNLKLDDELWNSMKLSNEAKKKILDKVKSEIKKFLKNNVIDLLKNK